MRQQEEKEKAMPITSGGAVAGTLFSSHSNLGGGTGLGHVDLETVPEGSEDSASVRGRAPVRLKAYHMSRWATGSVGVIEEEGGDVGASDRGETDALPCRFWMDDGELRAKIGRFLKSTTFDFLIGFVICANAVNIGVEQAFRSRNYESEAVAVLEHMFLCIYLIELLLQFYAFNLACFYDSWVVFDLVLVVTGVAAQWIIQPVFGSGSKFAPLMVLRAARLMRLAQTIRLLIKFKELWILVRGLLSSATTMLYTILLLFVILYILSLLGVEILHAHPKAYGPERDPEFARTTSQYFSSLPVAMVTLIQFVCLDNVALIYGPLVKHDPLLLFYFVSVILVVGIVVMNLVTAVIVNSALEQTAQDKDMVKSLEDERRKLVLKDLRRVFLRLDKDGSGEVSRVEIQNMGTSERTILAGLTGFEDPLDIFDALDVDGDGEIGIDEFCDGLWQVAISQTPIEIKRLEKQMEWVRSQMGEARKDRYRIYSMLSDLIELVKKQEKRHGHDRTTDGRSSRHKSPRSPKDAWKKGAKHEPEPVSEFSGNGFVSAVSARCQEQVAAAVISRMENVAEAATKAAVPAIFEALDVMMDGSFTVALSNALDMQMEQEEIEETADESRSAFQKHATQRQIARLTPAPLFSQQQQEYDDDSNKTPASREWLKDTRIHKSDDTLVSSERNYRRNQSQALSSRSGSQSTHKSSQDSLGFLEKLPTIPHEDGDKERLRRKKSSNNIEERERTLTLAERFVEKDGATSSSHSSNSSNSGHSSESDCEEIAHMHSGEVSIRI